MHSPLMGTADDEHSDVELVDVVDELGRYIRTAPRDEVHRQGDWHRVFHCLITTVRDGVPVAVLQRRSRSKAAFPGLLDFSATGHLAAGEAPLDGVRELTEELGITPEPESLVPLGIRRFADDTGEGTKNCELISTYLLRDDRPLSNYSLGRGEVDAVYDVPIGEFLDLIAGGPPITVKGVASAGRDDAHDVKVNLSVDDIVLPGSGYWVVLMVMAARFMAGKRPLAV